MFLTLVKPQFEAEAHEVGEGGIVRDPAIHARVLCDAVTLFATSGLAPLDLCVSPITGAKGNREFFLLGARGQRDEAHLLDSPSALEAQVQKLAEQATHISEKATQ